MSDIASPKGSNPQAQAAKTQAASGAQSFVGLCIGSGGWEHPAWKNLDYSSEAYRARQNRIDYNVNLFTDPFPIEDGQFQCAYMSHVVEHLSDRVALATLREARRVLKPGGILRIATPDFDRIADAYMRRETFFFTRFGFAKVHPDESIHQRFLRTFAAAYVQKSKFPDLPKLDDDEIQAKFADRATALDQALSLTREIPESYNGFSPSTHMNVWTGARLCDMLTEAGFADAWVSWYQGSRARPMTNRKVFDLTHPFMSLYVEGAA